MNAQATKECLDAAEQNALLGLSVHERLIQQGNDTVARVVWVIYQNTNRIAELIGAEWESLRPAE